MIELNKKFKGERKKLYDKVNKTRIKHGLNPIPFVNEPDPIYCSFCGKEPIDIEIMVEGLGVFICNECIQNSQVLISE